MFVQGLHVTQRSSLNWLSGWGMESLFLIKYFQTGLYRVYASCSVQKKNSDTLQTTIFFMSPPPRPCRDVPHHQNYLDVQGHNTPFSSYTSQPCFLFYPLLTPWLQKPMVYFLCFDCLIVCLLVITNKSNSNLHTWGIFRIQKQQQTWGFN